jgi:flagellar biosynthesis protein
MRVSKDQQGGVPPKGKETDGAEETVAVALEYDPKATEGAPRVLATGRGAVAEQILELAFAHGVKVRQDADLARVLTAVDVDSEIPIEAFAAVAEILAYVYRANGVMGGATELAGDSAAAFARAMADHDPGPAAAPILGGRPLVPPALDGSLAPSPPPPDTVPAPDRDEEPNA